MVDPLNPQVSLFDSAFNRRKKRSRIDDLLKKTDQFVDWRKLEAVCQPMYKLSRRGRPTIPIQFSLKCLILQYLYNLSDQALEDALIDRLSFQRLLGISFETDIPDFRGKNLVIRKIFRLRASIPVQEREIFLT